MIRRNLILICLFFVFQVSAQVETVFISGNIDSVTFKAVSIEKIGVRNHLRFNPDNLIPILPDKTFSSDIRISGKGFYKVGDYFVGHKMFLRPGDSIRIFLKKRLIKRKEDKTAYTMTASSQFPKNLTFFEEIDSIYPGPRFDTSYRSPAEFKKALINNYLKKVSLVHTYAKQKLVSKDFIPFAEAELKSIYIRGAASLFNRVSKSAFTKNYIQLPFEINLNDSVMAVSTQYFSSAALINNIYFLNNYDPEKYYSSLKKQYQAAESHYIGFLKDFLIGDYLVEFAVENDPDYDEIYNLFLKNCKNEVIKESTIKKVALKTSAKSKPSSPKKQMSLTFSELMKESFVEDILGNKLSLHDIFPENKITVIDSWATWCYPCLHQFPFIKKIEDRYSSNVNFVYLSFDKSRDKWIEYLNINKPGNVNQFRLLNEFDSPFAEYMKIEDIPRYILISEKGEKLQNGKMPIPSMYEDFTKVLLHFLDKND